jgi:steroid delta-isomerase-like uncharacterized protein
MSNKDIVRRTAEEPWGGDYSAIDELVAPGYIGHDPSQPDTIGPQGVKEFLDQFRTAYPDGKVTIDHQWEDGDTVISAWTGAGTQNGELMGIAPTGKQVRVTGITISRIADGQIAEEWTVWDTLGMLQQLGAVPAPTAAETTT